MTAEFNKIESERTDFLDQKDRKYPYKVNGRPSKNLLTAAVRHAKEFGHSDIAKKAQNMLDDLIDD